MLKNIDADLTSTVPRDFSPSSNTLVPFHIKKLKIAEKQPRVRRIGINQSCLPTIPTNEFITLVAGAGFECIELRWERVSSPEEIVSMCRRENISLISLNALEMNGTAAEIIRKAEHLVKLALALDTLLIVVPPRPPIAQQEFRTALKGIREIAKKAGVRLGFEFLGFKDAQINKIEDAAKIAKELDSTLVVDTFHFFLSRENPGILKKYDIEILHINDCFYDPAHPPSDDLARVLPGEGNFPLREVIQNYRGINISLEIFRVYPLPPEEFAKVAINSLRTLMR